MIAGDKTTVTVGWRTGPRDLDTSALLLGSDGRVRSDADFIFYNQPAAPDGSVRHTGKTPAGSATSECIDLGLDVVAADVDRVVISVSVDGGTFADVHDLCVTITPSGSPASYVFVPTAAVETALVLAEIYRRNGQWRLRAIGQGYNDGLAGLARDFGVDVS